MFKTGVKKVRVVAVASLLGLAATSMPASAHHGHNYIAPLAAAIAFGALIHHGHHRHHYHHHHRRHHGQYGPRGHYRHHRRHSHSHGGYHKRHRRW